MQEAPPPAAAPAPAPTPATTPTSILSESASATASASPTTEIIVEDSEFAKMVNPLSVAELRAQHPSVKWRTADYTRDDPNRIEVMIPKEVAHHRWAVMDRLSHSERRRGNTHALVIAGVRSIKGQPVRQRAEFAYLCDCLLPDMVILLLRNRLMELRTILFQPDDKQYIDPSLNAYACQRFNVDKVMLLSSLKETLHRMLHNISAKLWYTKDESPLTQVIKEFANDLKLSIDCPRHMMQCVRSIKTNRELSAIRRANSIAAESMQELIMEHEPHQGKHELGMLFVEKCRHHYAYQELPYEPKLTAGLGNVWLMDGSCQYAGYHGGLARYWPIHGRFSPPQKVLYNMLLEIRSKLCTLMCNTSSIARTPRELHATFLILLAGQLQKMRVLPDNLMRLPGTYKAVSRFTYFPTLIKHVGLDYELDGDQMLNYKLMTGNVVSLQLSVVIPNDCLQAYPEFRGLVCILNDCVYIKENHELDLLTTGCVSNARDVEELRDANKRLKCFAN